MSEENPCVYGNLLYYYNGKFYIMINNMVTAITETQLYLKPNEIAKTFIVESNSRHNLFTCSKFKVAEAFCDGYNNALSEYCSNWTNEIAKIYFEN